MKKNNSQAQQKVTKQQVRSMIRNSMTTMVEAKVTYTTQNGGVDFSGTIASMTAALTRGDAAINQYTGQLLNPKRLRINYTWSTDQVFSTVRLMVFQWKDASIPLPVGILQYTGAVEAPHSPLYWTNHHKIHMLYNKTHTIYVHTVGAKCAKNFQVDIGNMLPIQFTAAAANTPQMNGIYVLAITDDGILLYPQLTYISELTYYDA